jgi:hypothetical protein
VMKTRAIRPLRASGAGVAAPAPLFLCRDRSSCAGGECFADARSGCEVFGEEGLELVERDQVGLVVEVNAPHVDAAMTCQRVGQSAGMSPDW